MDLAWVLWPIAAGMAAIIAGLVRWSGSARTPLGAGFVLFLLAMMASMFLGALIYVTWPGPNALILALWAAGVTMSLSVFPVVLLAVWEATSALSEGPTAAPRRIRSPARLALAVTGLVLLAELLMGRSFAIAAGALGTAPVDTAADALTWFTTTVCSPWFLFPMALEMGLAALWVGRALFRPVYGLLLSQAAVMLLAPPALAAIAWEVGSAAGASVVMAAIVGYLLVLEYRGQALPRAAASFAVRVVATFALMGAGLFVWALDGSTVLFAVAVVAQTVVYFGVVVVPEEYRPPVPDPGADAAVADARSRTAS